jgi:hypothetical protein
MRKMKSFFVSWRENAIHCLGKIQVVVVFSPLGSRAVEIKKSFQKNHT